MLLLAGYGDCYLSALLVYEFPMTQQVPDGQPQLSEAQAQELMRSLLHKEGTWVDWGKACQKLHQGGYNAQQIFETTGFQGSQQNLVIVAAQVYDSLVKKGATEQLLSYYQGPRSDVLYEFRILNQEQRLAAAELAMSKRLDVDGARTVAKAVQDFARLSQLPEGFTAHPGDAVAYQYWRGARGKKELADRSRLIAQGLKFAHSDTAREKIEQLLTDFSVIPQRQAPLLPLYRLEQEEELPRVVPLAGSLPLTSQKIAAIPAVEQIEPFRVIKTVDGGNFIPIPGWQAVLQAVDPVAIICRSEQLPKAIPGKSEELVVVIDRQAKTWDFHSFFLVDKGEEVALQWFEEEPPLPIVGQLILVLRPKKILDENIITTPWQMDD